MVRVITQQTFNDVVKENMEVFEMSMTEAIHEATTQFEAQGVDLTNIVKGIVQEGSDPIGECIKRLQDSSDGSDIQSDLKFLKGDCDREVAKKILAGKHGAYNVLLKLLDKHKENKETQILIYQTLIALMSGYPDLLDEKGVLLMSNTLAKSKDLEIIKYTLKWCRECCIKHERNRQMVFGSYVIKTFSGLLETQAVKDVCGLIRSLCLDDDIRFELSKAHEHARSLAIDLLCPLTSLLAKTKENNIVINEILLTMSTLMVRHEFCSKVDEAGGLVVISRIVLDFYNDERIIRSCLLLLKTLAGNDDVKLHIVQNDNLITSVMHSIEKHKVNQETAAAGLGLIAALALRSPANSQKLCDLNAAEIVVDCMKLHQKDMNTQRRGCWAVRNIVSRSKVLSGQFLTLGIEEILLNVIKNYKACVDDAKAALRDLGCNVKLVEQWTGKGTALKN